MQLQIFPAEVLRKRAALVPDPVRVVPYVEPMLRIVKAQSGIGLAAPQIGLSERFFVLSLPGDRPRVMVNPDIVDHARRTVRSEEMCLSLPGVTVDVSRWTWVDLRFRDEHGSELELRARGLLGRAVQHEVDHLNGVLCIDHIDPKRRERIVRRLEALRTYGTATRTPS